MKKYYRVISIAILVAFCMSLYSISSSETTIAKPSQGIKTEEISPLKPKPLVTVEHYQEKDIVEVKSKLDSLLNRINRRYDFNGAILVAKNNKIVYQNQVGYADFKSKTLLNEDSEFQLASVSKQFTAAAVMMLIEQNKINLNDTVNKFFPNFPYQGVTIKNLLNHTAGLPKYFWIAEHKWKKDRVPSNTEVMELLSEAKVRRFFRPGRRFDYSNTGYMVLASIIEKVSGLTFSEFLAKNIFTPLDMKHTYVYSYQNDSIRKNQLVGYRLARGWRHVPINGTVNDGVVGDKNVYTTSEDLFKWYLGLNSGKMLSQESLDLMYAKGKTVYGREVPYGFGFRIKDKKESKIYHHGRWNGFRTGLTNYVDDELVIIVLEHTSYSAIKSLNKKIKGIVKNNLRV